MSVSPEVSVSGLEIGIAFGAAALIAGSAWRARMLTVSGAIAAAVLGGTITAAGGWTWHLQHRPQKRRSGDRCHREVWNNSGIRNSYAGDISLADQPGGVSTMGSVDSTRRRCTIGGRDAHQQRRRPPGRTEQVT